MPDEYVRTGMSTKRSSSENATMASKREWTSARETPCSEALR